MRDYDSWKTRTPDDDLKVFCSCEWCGGEIYVGEEYIEVQGDNIHDDCFSEYAEEHLDPIRKIAGDE
jgi:hypothetical protein